MITRVSHTTPQKSHLSLLIIHGPLSKNQLVEFKIQYIDLYLE